jgi:hypothetical protein
MKKFEYLKALPVICLIFLRVMGFVGPVLSTLWKLCENIFPVLTCALPDLKFVFFSIMLKEKHPSVIQNIILQICLSEKGKRCGI